MSYAETPDFVSPDDQLPPVEPPSAGFIVRLFVIPALIVLIMFALGAGIKWLVERESNPMAYVEALRRNNDGRWQAAHDLADVLRNPRNDPLKDDRALARELAATLATELAAGAADDLSVQLRVYLCNALGEFRVPDVLDVLVKAATSGRDEKEREVRFSAMKALAVYLSAAPKKDWIGRADVLATVLAASRDEAPMMRSTAAFALGAAGTPKALKRLEEMLDDGYPDVRYNAATMLARRGDERAVRVLAEMLEPEQAAAIGFEEQEQSRQYKRDSILVNALRATKDLAAENPGADLAPLAAPVERLTADDLAPGIRVQADEVLIELKKRRS
ncbi:MAG TPA: HEAT repeat domain-containing protein [Pirellulales bacterium]|jgi:HEAT repeat protein|nr:HEAT repeat domain-containing protein [Pirellulales bacterium]